MRETWSGQLRGPLFGLAPDGVFRASALALGAVGSYPTFSPLPVSLAKLRRFDFLWHCPSAGLAAWPPACIPDQSGLRGIAPCGVRTFLPRLAPEAILRPSKIAANLAEAKTSYKHKPGIRKLLLRHRQAHIAGVIEDPATVWAGDDLLVALAGHDHLALQFHVAAAANAVRDADHHVIALALAQPLVARQDRLADSDPNPHGAAERRRLTDALLHVDDEYRPG